MSSCPLIESVLTPKELEDLKSFHSDPDVMTIENIDQIGVLMKGSNYRLIKNPGPVRYYPNSKFLIVSDAQQLSWGMVGEFFRNWTSASFVFESGNGAFLRQDGTYVHFN